MRYVLWGDPNINRWFSKNAENVSEKHNFFAIEGGSLPHRDNQTRPNNIKDSYLTLTSDVDRRRVEISQQYQNMFVRLEQI